MMLHTLCASRLLRQAGATWMNFMHLSRPRTLASVALAMLSLLGGVHSHADIAVAGVIESSGGGAAAGSSFKNGYLMAIDEVNDKGGVLGQKIVLTQFDIETSPDAAKAAVAKAVAMKPFAVLGPVFSGLTAASSPLTAPESIPHFTGGEAASLTRKFHPSLLRTSLSQLGSAPRMGAFVTHGLGARKVGLISIDNEFGRDGRAALTSAIKRNSAAVVFDAQVKPGQKDVKQIVDDLMKTEAEALLIYATENETADLLGQLKASKFRKPIVSDGLVASQKVIDAANGGTEGVYAHMIASAVVARAPVQAFVARYQARYGSRPDINSMKGFVAIHVIKAGLEMAGKVDQALFLKTIKDQRLDNGKYPDLLSPISYDFFGDINRETYYAVIRDGAPRIIASIRATEGGSVELASGRTIVLNSNEFRSLLREEPKADPTAGRAKR